MDDEQTRAPPGARLHLLLDALARVGVVEFQAALLLSPETAASG
jgi:hypothetical protein